MAENGRDFRSRTENFCNVKKEIIIKVSHSVSDALGFELRSAHLKSNTLTKWPAGTWQNGEFKNR